MVPGTWNPSVVTLRSWLRTVKAGGAVTIRRCGPTRSGAVLGAPMLVMISSVLSLLAIPSPLYSVYRHRVAEEVRAQHGQRLVCCIEHTAQQCLAWAVDLSVNHVFHYQLAQITYLGVRIAQ